MCNARNDHYNFYVLISFLSQSENIRLIMVQVELKEKKIKYGMTTKCFNANDKEI
jgi:hypothetical protein